MCVASCFFVFFVCVAALTDGMAILKNATTPLLPSSMWEPRF